MKKILVGFIFLLFTGQVYAQDIPNLAGTAWRLIDQSPSETELLSVSSRIMGIEEESDEDYKNELIEMNIARYGVENPEQIVRITDNELIWEHVPAKDHIMSFNNSITLPYYQEGDQLIIDWSNSTDDEALMRVFNPQSYTITEYTEDQMTLVTDRMPIYGDISVTYVFKRIDS